MDKKIYMLTCEDLSHLGGPMGSEYTTTIFSKIFSSVEKAKKYAETFYWRDGLKWVKSKNKWVVDAYAFGYEIKEIGIDPKPIKYQRS